MTNSSSISLRHVTLMAVAYVVLFALLLMLVCRDAEEHFNGITKDKDVGAVQAFFNRLYFSTVTATTLGYGDISPKSNAARALVMLFISLPLIHLFASILKMSKKLHLVQTLKAH